MRKPEIFMGKNWNKINREIDQQEYFTFIVPEQAQGASKLLQLSNSASWHILHVDISGSFNSNSSTYITTSSPMFSCF